jgi:hypothetical protein
MSTHRKITAATITALLAGAGVATAADAPIVSKQHTSTAKRAPMTIPGSGVQRGERLPSGARLVYRDVTLENDQTATFNIKAPDGKRLRALATREGQDVGFMVVDRANYAGKTKVQVRAYANPNADGEVEGRIYGLAR